jgi:radical SAM superfamily enzyme YgiQ (UPF0313 family)
MARTSKGSTKRPALFLINPRIKYKHYGAQDELSHLVGKRKMSVPLALPLVAALTPDHWDVRIIDDETDEIPFDASPDLVGITTLASTVDRAFEIADKFRKRDVKVVMGGSYATFMKEEVAAHADAVIVGEAEGIWHRFLADFERGDTDQYYVQETEVPFSVSPPPRWDLVKTNEIMTLGVQATRGCPYNCEFCLVNKMFGHKMRFRDPADVAREIKGLPLKKVFFVDDNLTIKKSYARELVKRLRPLGISWVCQCSIDVSRDEALLREMVEAGCLSILIGFESLSAESLLEANKKHNRIEDYEAAISRIHAFGINVLASFVVGFDADTAASFDQIARFMQRTNLVYAMISVLAAAPGTDLYDRMSREGRLTDIPRGYVNGVFPCMRYRHFSQTELLERYFEFLETTHAYGSLRERAVPLFGSGSFARSGTSEEIGVTEKAATSLKLVNRYLLTKDREKRALFKDLFRLVRQKKASPESIVVFLLSMEAVHDYLAKSKDILGEVREVISRADSGSWTD